MKILYTLTAMLAPLALASCVVVPSVSEQYDQTCKLTKKHIELSVEQVDAFDQLNCSSNHECKSQFVGQVVGAALLFPLSAIVSGSIAVVGNTMYWLIEQGHCAKEESPDNT